jgi:DNA-binding CsgD family transcriptional regulator
MGAGVGMSLSAGDYRRVLDLVAGALRCAGQEFPDVTVTGLLCQVLDAEAAGVGDVDLRGTASRRWAGTPRPVPMGPAGFHQFAIGHPLTRAHRRSGGSVPLRLSDVASPREMRRTRRELGMPHVLTIPLAVTPWHLCAVALMRSGQDFPARGLQLAGQIQPLLGGIYALRGRMSPHQPVPPGPSWPCGPDAGIRVTSRELAVLDLMADGLIAAAIARQLGISPRTVSKHIESIYRKLGTHDRTSAVLRGQAIGLLPVPCP